MSKRKKIVLDEDKYVECLEKIIERDFFPDYEKLKDQKEYLDAQESKNFEKMRQLALKYTTRSVSERSTTSSLQTPAATGARPSPASFETPEIKTPSSINEESLRLGYKPQKKMKKDEIITNTKLPLDQFLGKYSSEDCESFKTILDKTDEEQRVKNAWLYEAEERHKQMCHDMMKLEQSADVLPITDGTKQGNNLQVSNVGDRRATIPLNTWEYKAKNPLMYYPEGNYKSLDDHMFKKPKVISHANTRFSGNPFRDDQVNRDKVVQAVKENQQQICGEKVGCDGKSIIPQSPHNVNGFSIVSDSPMTSGIGCDESPLMTWGEVGNTPARLDTPSSSSRQLSTFRFPEESLRDKLAHQMVDDVMKKKKAKKEQAEKQLKASVLRRTPKYRKSLPTSERISNFSPAVQKLFGKRLTKGSDKMLKASYTPSPMRRTSAFSSPRIVRTPQQQQNITDNLLHLPKQQQDGASRNKAADFF